MKRQVRKRPAEELIEPPVIGRQMTDAEARKRMAAIIALNPARYASLRRIGALADKIAAKRKVEGGAR
jgi:hypothetical protein